VNGVLIVLLMLLPGAACAQAQSPAGLWTTYSDRSGKADGLVRIVEENGEFHGIEGRFYRCSMRVSDGGRTLELRGYVGIPLFGRSQMWSRRE
jgi:hypothetical protein